MKIELEYMKEILRKLQAMADGAIGVISGEDAEKKVETLKIIIDWKEDRTNGFEITFNDAFTKFRKRIINQK